jgi:hypothetical protein
MRCLHTDLERILSCCEIAVQIKHSAPKASVPIINRKSSIINPNAPLAGARREPQPPLVVCRKTEGAPYRIYISDVGAIQIQRESRAMNITDTAAHALDMLREHEKAIGRLYETYAHRFPQAANSG